MLSFLRRALKDSEIVEKRNSCFGLIRRPFAAFCLYQAWDNYLLGTIINKKIDSMCLKACTDLSFVNKVLEENVKIKSDWYNMIS